VDRTYTAILLDISGPMPDMFIGQFQPNVRSLFWSYLANQVSVWPHSSSSSFITLLGWFLSYWLLFFINLLQGFLLGVLDVGHRPVSCKRNLIRLPFTPPPPVAFSVFQLLSEHLYLDLYNHWVPTPKRTRPRIEQLPWPDPSKVGLGWGSDVAL
jgi:hypothetical protein